MTKFFFAFVLLAASVWALERPSIQVIAHTFCGGSYSLQTDFLQDGNTFRLKGMQVLRCDKDDKVPVSAIVDFNRRVLHTSKSFASRPVPSGVRREVHNVTMGDLEETLAVMRALTSLPFGTIHPAETSGRK